MSKRDSIERFSVQPDEERMATLVDAFQTSVSDDEIALLAQYLAASGNSLNKQAEGTDVASTGGPSSLSTLLCPLQLRSFGQQVPKLSVPGRPAGGIDVLATIPGYNIHLETAHVEAALARCGYAHFTADEHWAPLDATLFRFRQRVGAQALAPFVVASLLAKKIAVGLSRVGLDVRVGPHGNFGADFREARKNAERFVSVAALVGIDAVCVLSDATVPYQPFIGRGEALLALALLFENRAPPALGRHVAECHRLSAFVAQAPRDPMPEPTVLLNQFVANLEAQGSSFDAFLERVEAVRSARQVAVPALRSGYATVDQGAVRTVLVDAQRQTEGATEFSDPAGLVLSVEWGQLVKQGDTLAQVRAANAPAAADLATRLQSCFRVKEDPPQARQLSEVVGNA